MRLRCGTNKPVKKKKLLAKILDLLSAPIPDLPEVEIIQKGGIHRTAIPYSYEETFSFEGGTTELLIDFYFLDTEKTDTIAVQPYQVFDPDPLMRMVGNNIPFKIDLTLSADVFERFGLKHTHIPPHVLNYLEKREPNLLKTYIYPLLYELSQTQAQLLSMVRRIHPLEQENASLKNQLSFVQHLINSTSSILDLRQILEGAKPHTHEYATEEE